MEGVRLPSPEKDCYLKKYFPNMLSNTFSDFILDMGVTDHTDTMIDNIENKIESLHLQEWSLRNRPLWKLRTQ